MLPKNADAPCPPTVRRSFIFIAALVSLAEALCAGAAQAQATVAAARTEMAAATVSCPSRGCPAGVAWLLTYREAGDQVAGSGTGITACSAFVISPRRLMTAKHCLPASAFAAASPINGKMVAVIPRRSAGVAIQRIDVTSVSAASPAMFATFSHHAQDYAILQLASDATGGALRLSADRLPLAGERVSAHVFESNSTTNSLRATYRLLTRGTLLERNVFQPVTIAEAPATLLVSGLRVRTGHSGGAVLNAAGAVIGLVSFIYPGDAIRVLTGFDEAFEGTPRTHTGLTSVYCAVQSDSVCDVDLEEESVFDDYLVRLLDRFALPNWRGMRITARLQVR